VGDLALHLAAVKADPKDFEENPDKYDVPDSVIGFMAGELGELPGGWPEPFRTKVLAGRERSIEIKPLSDSEKEALAGDSESVRSTLNELLFPGPNKEFLAMREQYGDLSVLNSLDYLYGLEENGEHTFRIEKGVVLIVGLEAIGAPDDKGIRTVMATMNGQLRPVFVKDKSIKVEERKMERADSSNPGHVGAPFAGVVTPIVEVGDEVTAGQPVATIEAMKMEANITASVDGKV